MIRICQKAIVSVFIPLVICAVLIANFSGCSSIVKSNQTERTVWLSSLNLEKMTSGWNAPQKDKSIQSKPLRIGGIQFENGVGTHANSLMHVDLKGSCRRFSAYVGIDDEVEGKAGSVRFKIYADGKRLYDSGVIKAGEKAREVDVDLKGCKIMKLVVDAAGDSTSHDHANWAQAAFIVAGKDPEAIDAPVINEKKVILTPKPGPLPRINGPKVYGCRAGRPFIYRIPCTGKRPITFSAENLPETLYLNQETGIIRGTAPEERGEYAVILKAANSRGSMQQAFTIVVGDSLALTPPMGWNSWYIHYARVTDGHMRRAADASTTAGWLSRMTKTL